MLFVINLNSRADMLFSIRREKLVWVISKKLKSHVQKLKSHAQTFPAFRNIINNIDICIFEKNEVFWTEPPFRANLLFGYAQNDLERTSFSGSTVTVSGKTFLEVEQSVFVLSTGISTVTATTAPNGQDRVGSDRIGQEKRK